MAKPPPGELDLAHLPAFLDGMRRARNGAWLIMGGSLVTPALIIGVLEGALPPPVIAIGALMIVIGTVRAIRGGLEWRGAMQRMKRE